MEESGEEHGMHSSDEPIKEPSQDVLGRARLAEVLAEQIRATDPAGGIVYGILGPWGSGKTSLINLIRAEFERADHFTVLDFNPWLFSGTDELVQHFFSELAEQLRLQSGRFDTVADELERYGDVIAPLQVLPVVGAWIERVSGAGEAIKKLRNKGDGGAFTLRRRVEERLRELDAPIIVVVDDVDRLTTSEIREIFKLVRLTARFPNLIYLVAFDRARVEAALEEDRLPGRDYLEKIIQVAFDIPAVPVSALRNQIGAAMDAALDSVTELGPFNPTYWPDVFDEVIRPLIRNMRDVRRFAAALPITVRSLSGQVELADVFALEAIRVFLPDVFALAAQSQQALTSPPSESTFFGPRDEDLQSPINQLIEAGGQHREVVESLLRRVFPNGARHLPGGYGGSDLDHRMLRERRVAHPDVLRYYFERVAGGSLTAFWSAERAAALLSEKEALDTLLRSHDASQWVEIVHALEAFEDEYAPEHPVPTSTVLLNLLAEMPKRPRSVLDFYDEDVVVSRVVLRLLRRLPDPDAVAGAVEAILPGLNSLWSKARLLFLVGREEGVGHALVEEDVSERLEAALRGEVRDASPQALTAEPNLLRLLQWTKLHAEADEPPLVISLDPLMGGALLRAALTEARSQTVGTRAVQREQQLHWDSLVAVVGGEDHVRQIVKSCEGIENDPKLTAARDLAIRHLDDGRPGRR